MAKEKTSLNKKKIAIITLGLLCFILIVINFDIPIPFRYEFKGTSQGYIYKIDRFTGKAWIVTPLGEKEVPKYEIPKSPEEHMVFPLSLLELRGVELNWRGEAGFQNLYIEGTLYNKSTIDSATNVVLRVDVLESETSTIPVDTKEIILVKSSDQLGPLSSKRFSELLVSPNKEKMWYWQWLIKSAEKY